MKSCCWLFLAFPVWAGGGPALASLSWEGAAILLFLGNSRQSQALKLSQKTRGKKEASTGQQPHPAVALQPTAFAYPNEALIFLDTYEIPLISSNRHKGSFVSHKEEESHAIWRKLDATGDSHIKLVSERQSLYIPSHVWFLGFG